MNSLLIFLVIIYFSKMKCSCFESKYLFDGEPSENIPDLGTSSTDQCASMNVTVSSNKTLSYLRKCYEGEKMCAILVEQESEQIKIYDVISYLELWYWDPYVSNVQPIHYNWFNALSDAKVVYGGDYLIITASGGGVALVRISDKCSVFYSYAGGNTHSVELLPDGNLVSASSDGNYLALFKVDPEKSPYVFRQLVTFPYGHNVVWDRKRNRLWAAGNRTFSYFQYNYDCEEPNLKHVISKYIDEDQSHELFPVYGEDRLWYTTWRTINIYNIYLDEFEYVQSYRSDGFKSVSSGPPGFPTMLLRNYNDDEWWSDTLVDLSGDAVFQRNDFDMYKARWFLPNTFGYPKYDKVRFCKVSGSR